MYQIHIVTYCPAFSWQSSQITDIDKTVLGENGKVLFSVFRRPVFFIRNALKHTNDSLMLKGQICKLHVSIAVHLIQYLHQSQVRFSSFLICNLLFPLRKRFVSTNFIGKKKKKKEGMSRNLRSIYTEIAVTHLQWARIVSRSLFWVVFHVH